MKLKMYLKMKSKVIMICTKCMLLVMYGLFGLLSITAITGVMFAIYKLATGY